MKYKFKKERFMKQYNLWLTGWGRTKERATKHLRAQINRYRKTPDKMVGRTKYGTMARGDLIQHLNEVYDEKISKEIRKQAETNKKSKTV